MDQALGQLLTFLNTLASSYTWWQMLVFFVLVLVFVMAINYKKTKPIWEWVGKVLTGRRLKRTCRDCMSILSNKRERFNIEREKLSSQILKGQMVFAEHKLGQIELLAVKEFDQLWASNKAKIQGTTDVVGEILKQQRLFTCILRETLAIVRDEVRRSYKENGFYEMDEAELQGYIRNRNKVIMALLSEHFRDTYPPAENMVVAADQLNSIFDKIAAAVGDIVSEMYKQAGEHRKETLAKIDRLENAFKAEVDAIANEK